MQTHTQAHTRALSFIGADCQARRTGLGLSRAELARLALVDASTIARFEAGVPVASLTLRRIGRALEQAEEAAS